VLEGGEALNGAGLDVEGGLGGLSHRGIGREKRATWDRFGGIAGLRAKRGIIVGVGGTRQIGGTVVGLGAKGMNSARQDGEQRATQACFASPIRDRLVSRGIPREPAPATNSNWVDDEADETVRAAERGGSRGG